MSKTVSSVAKTDSVKHRTTPLKDSIFSVPNYPTKLTIFMLQASRFWWVRYYDGGKIYKRSTKTEDKRKAIEFAKDFFNEINFKKHQGLIRGKGDSFEVCAAAVVEQQKYKVKSDDLSAESAQINVYRLKKAVLPFFSGMSVKDVDYFKLQAFMNSLIDQELNPSTISDYMNLVGKVLRYAHKRRFVEGLPEIPKPKRVDNARGWFTTSEYKKLWSAARSLSNKTYEIRKRVDKDGKEIVFTCERLLPNVFENAKLKREGIKQKRLTKAQRE